MFARGPLVLLRTSSFALSSPRNMNNTNNTDPAPAQAPDDHGVVGFLRHISSLFEEALYVGETDHFMEELYALWLRDWLEAPEDVQRQKNSLRHAMLAISHERLPDLMFIDQGLAPQFTPIPNAVVTAVSPAVTSPAVGTADSNMDATSS
ncbi:uncharacterized protein ARMOST_17751 [Armillaria ostoyae]|uniref:Uncharacterized protein n=1 Tax=Armillaria ostoyae TaxID=47428 RepID=A0A284RZV7_ARMOS|nr:uncharacterized protein ARMOST_17751 [Armillaria ostoyae]